MHDSLGTLVRAAGLGFAAGVLVLVALVLTGRSTRTASSLSFSLAALLVGFGVTTWAGTLLLGETLPAVRSALDLDGDASAGEFRQAMAVLSALGGGAMAGSVAASSVLGVVL